MNTWKCLGRCLAIAGICIISSTAVRGQAFTYTEAVANGEWSQPSTWSAGVPTDTQAASINGNLTVSLNSFGNITNLLDVGNVAGETGNFDMIDGDLTVDDFIDQVTEPNTPSIRLGQLAGSTGNMTMSGGQVFILSVDANQTEPGFQEGFGNGDLMVGDNGTGTFSMSGGTFSADDEVFVGFGAGSAGELNVSGGTFSTTRRNLLVGFLGPNTELGLPGAHGEVNISGTAQVTIAGVVHTSFSAGSTSVFNMSGGTLNSGDFIHATRGDSTFNHTGGDFNPRVFIVGDNFNGAGVTGTYNISGTATVDIPLIFWVGAVGGSNGFVNQTGGTINAGAIGVGRDGTGTYEMSAGALNQLGTDGFTPNNHLIIGQVGNSENTLQGTGTFIQTGGDVTVATGLFLGDYDNSEGLYKISGGSLNVTGTGSHTNPGDFEDFIGDFSVGGALAANALNSTLRVDPTSPTDPQGQALDANGAFIVSGSAATIYIAGNFLANPADKHANRSDATGENRSNSATLGFEIFDSSGTSIIDVGGVADLDGAVIDLDLMSGFTPTIGDTFDLLTASSFGATGTGTTQNIGTGADFTLASEDNGVFSLAVVSGGNGSILQATFLGGGGGFTADFDNDGDVDGNDLVKWKDSFSAATAEADADNDGDSDGADFLAWQQQLGSTSAAPAAAAIPEPSAALLLSIAAAAFVVRRR